MNHQDDFNQEHHEDSSRNLSTSSHMSRKLMFKSSSSNPNSNSTSSSSSTSSNASFDDGSQLNGSTYKLFPAHNERKKNNNDHNNNNKNNTSNINIIDNQQCHDLNDCSRIKSSISHQSNYNSISRSTPIAVELLYKFAPWNISTTNKRRIHKALVLLMTFIAYTAFHMGRRPLAVVKHQLHNHDCKSTSQLTQLTSKKDVDHIKVNETVIQNSENIDKVADNCINWAPFDKDDQSANILFGYLDTAFLASYAMAMFFSGIIAERVNLRYFITIGCSLSGLGLICAGLAHNLKIHSLAYFIIVQALSGLFQSTGWPVVVTCVGNWLSKSERNLMFGLWNGHTSLGNILGALIAGLYVKEDWGLSFIVPGIIMIIVAALLFLFLVPSPIDAMLIKDSHLDSHNHENENDNTNTTKNNVKGIIPQTYRSSNNGPDILVYKASDGELANTDRQTNGKAASFWQALCIPGVIEFSLCLFFCKLVSYTFLYWLPKYLAATRSLDSEQSAFTSIWFDVGGILGAVIAGITSEIFKFNGVICGIMLILAIPAMFTFQNIVTSGLEDIFLQILVGGLVNGPYGLITTTVSANLGDIIKDGRAMATVAAILDGMGSIGAVAGPLLAGLITSSNDWSRVFTMLLASDSLAALCLTGIIWRETKGCFSRSAYLT